MKVAFFTWRLLRNRLSIRDNLFRYGVIFHDAQFCVSGCGELETTNHLFLHCPIFGSLWYMLRDWVWFSFVGPVWITYHIIQFAYLTCGSKVQCSFMRLFWFICVWVILNEMDDIVFNHKENSVPHLLDKVKRLL